MKNRTLDFKNFQIQPYQNELLQAVTNEKIVKVTLQKTFLYKVLPTNILCSERRVSHFGYYYECGHMNGENKI